MKQAEKRAHKRALKRRQKLRRKEKRQQEQAQPAPQPAAQPAMEETMEAVKEEVFSTDEVRGALRGALETVMKVMRMVNKAIDAVDETDADKVFAARVTAQRRRDDFRGFSSDEYTLIRVHPLFALWKLADQCARHVENLLRLTNPKEFAQWKLAADKALQSAKKLEAKAEQSAA